MAAELREQVGVESTITPGGGGVFDIKLDGKLVYSKKQTGRFPKPGEAVRLLQGGGADQEAQAGSRALSCCET